MNYDPLQALFVLHRQEWKPYYEAIRAMHIPEQIFTPVRNSWVLIYVSPTHSIIADRDELQRIRALDSADRMDTMTKAAQHARTLLPTGQREVVDTLSAYPTHDLQFDFSEAAKAWVVSRRGICPGRDVAPEKYNAWVKSKALKRRSYLQVWSCARGIVEPVFLEVEGMERK